MFNMRIFIAGIDLNYNSVLAGVNRFDFISSNAIIIVNKYNRLIRVYLWFLL